MSNEVKLIIDEDGVVSRYVEPFGIIELKTEEEFNRLQELVKLGKQSKQTGLAKKTEKTSIISRIVDMENELNLIYKDKKGDENGCQKQNLKLLRDLNMAMDTLTKLKSIIIPLKL